MRILLNVPRAYNPKQMYREYPLGVGYIGTVLQQHGHTVSIFDGNVEGSEDQLLIQQVEAFQPDIVGFSVITPNYPVARNQIRLLHQFAPDVFLIAGGIHASLFPTDLLDDGVHVVVLGEGELTMPTLIEYFATGHSYDGLPGIACQEDNQARKHFKLSTGIHIDDLPFVDRKLYNLSKYAHHSIMCSRGCPYKCKFCCNYTDTLNTQGVRVRHQRQVIDEMIHLRNEFGAKEVFFVDDIFFLRRPDAKSFCRQLIDEGVNMSWIAQMRVDSIDDELAGLMAEAGCRRVYFGIESGSDSILRATNKGMTTDDIRKGVLAAKHAGLRVKTGWIYGLPGTIDEQHSSLSLMLELRPNEISIHQLIPFPGTDYYKHAVQYGIRIANPKAFESFCYGGLGGNITFDYLSQSQFMELLENTTCELEASGYVSSDNAQPNSAYIYTTPLNELSMNVFHPVVEEFI